MSDKKYFRGSFPPACSICTHAYKFSGGELFCMKKGIVSADFCCKAYDYDPLKRVPAVRSIGKDYKPEDFKI